MRYGMRLSVDVSKILKDALYQGKKGTYLDMTIFFSPDEEDQYGNHGMITQELGKERRDAGEKGPILGNGKIFMSKGNDNRQSPVNAVPDKGVDTSEDFDIPF